MLIVISGGSALVEAASYTLLSLSTTSSAYLATNVRSENRYRMGPAHTLFKTNASTDII